MAGLSQDDYIKCEKTGTIPLYLREGKPFLHFCPEWDFALVDDDMGEINACMCFDSPELKELQERLIKERT